MPGIDPVELTHQRLLRPLIDQRLSVVFYDLTTLRAEGLSEQPGDLRRFGLAKEGIIGGGPLPPPGGALKRRWPSSGSRLRFFWDACVDCAAGVIRIELERREAAGFVAGDTFCGQRYIYPPGEGPIPHAEDRPAPVASRDTVHASAEDP